MYKRIFSGNNTEFENDQTVLKNVLKYKENVDKGFLPDYSMNPLNSNGYDCIDFAKTLCEMSGGTNCGVSHSGFRPKTIDGNGLKIYFTDFNYLKR